MKLKLKLVFNMPAITISRVSTEDQKIQGNSLPAQEKNAGLLKIG
jgi:hypothetical protein